MTSLKDTIITKAEIEIATAKAQLEYLEKQHDDFRAEDDAQEAHELVERGIRRQQDAMLNKAYAGTFGTRDAWYHWYRGQQNEVTRRLEAMGYTNDDVTEAMKRVSKERLEAIELSAEYQQLEADRHAESQAAMHSISKEHRALHDAIEKQAQLIRWAENRKDKAMNDKGWLSTYGKDLKRREQLDAVHEAREARIAEIKNHLGGAQ